MPLNMVFAYIDNPRNEPDWLSNMIEVKDVRGSGVGNHYSMVAYGRLFAFTVFNRMAIDWLTKEGTDGGKKKQ